MFQWIDKWYEKPADWAFQMILTFLSNSYEYLFNWLWHKMHKWCKWTVIVFLTRAFVVSQFVIVSLTGWGLLLFGGYKFLTGGKKEKKEEV